MCSKDFIKHLKKHLKKYLRKIAVDNGGGFSVYYRIGDIPEVMIVCVRQGLPDATTPNS
ncbi:MAG: hypothetical protein LBT46_05495 [Planctomycetaceae bacterium]|jgi:hypothetical protein|nr:hypothetical protein [Planctomycetaceae bacterium]